MREFGYYPWLYPIDILLGMLGMNQRGEYFSRQLIITQVSGFNKGFGISCKDIALLCSALCLNNIHLLYIAYLLSEAKTRYVFKTLLNMLLY